MILRLLLLDFTAQASKISLSDFAGATVTSPLESARQREHLQLYLVAGNASLVEAWRGYRELWSG